MDTRPTFRRGGRGLGTRLGQERLGSVGMPGEKQGVKCSQIQKQRDTRDKRELIGRPIILRGRTWRGTPKANRRVHSKQDRENPLAVTKEARIDDSLSKNGETGKGTKMPGNTNQGGIAMTRVREGNSESRV